ncbi:MAG: glycosyl hydrolase family 43 [Ruminococcaceae bacterium]|nr:glycosyl hydrolase family 43 [Oscillospiraceae bacterium]
MQNLTIQQLLDAEFSVSDESPVIKPFDGTFITADPSLLTPDNCHDKKWHMFFHTNFGVYHATSDDGISFRKPVKILKRAMRPNINYIDGTYYLFYERTRSLFANALNVVNLVRWKSEIFVTESKDLKNWTTPKKVIAHTKDYEISHRGTALSNPFLIQEEGKNRLYYSCGMTYIDDCKFCEPTYISYAESENITYGYTSADKPFISPDKNNPYLNLCSGCLKVYKLKDGYVGVQNGIYEKDGKSHSAIFMMTSSDGLNFTFRKMLIEPKTVNGKDWMKQFVYASHLVKQGNTLRLYFNARDISDPIRGRECIGFAVAHI